MTQNLVRIPVVSRGDASNVWLRVALQSFGGPAGQIAVPVRPLSNTGDETGH